LVKNVPSFAIYLVPNDYRAFPKMQENTKQWLLNNFSEQGIEESFNEIINIKPNEKEYFEPILLLENINYETAIAMRIQSIDYPGVIIDVQPKRSYLNYYKNNFVQSLAHILGYQGKINNIEFKELKEKGYLLNDAIGKTGIEKQFEKILRGKYGKEQIEVDSTGRAVKIISQQDVEKGHAIFLTIDLKIQSKLEEIMRQHMGKSAKSRAVAIVMDPKQGNVKALISLPGYDNNLFSLGLNQDQYQELVNNPDRPMYNRAISGEYPSGSTIKPIFGLAALEEEIITERTSFLSVGGISIAEWFFPDWRAGGHGYTDIRKAIADSVNTFFYIIGGGHGDKDGMGPEKLKEYATKFGLSKLTGIDLPNEKAGFLPDPDWKKQVKNEEWYIGDTYHFSIGQGDVLVTPLQVANYTAAFANGGTLFKPNLVERFLDKENDKLILVEPEILNQDFADDYNIEVIRQGMKRAVTSGSARLLSLLPVSAAGKTGTAQWGTDKIPHAWFTSFAPYEDPELVVTILVEEGEEGSKISTQIAYEFYDWYFGEY